MNMLVSLVSCSASSLELGVYNAAVGTTNTGASDCDRLGLAG